MVYKTLTTTSDPDDIVAVLLNEHGASQKVLSKLMQEEPQALEDVIDLHVAQHMAQTADPHRCTTFEQARSMFSLPSSRADLLRSTRGMFELYEDKERLRAMRALALFELFLFSSAPAIATSDFWLHIVTHDLVQPLGAHLTRLLSPDVLCSVLSTSFGTLLTARCRRLGFSPSLIAVIDNIRTAETSSDACFALRFVATSDGIAIAGAPFESIVPSSAPAPMEY